jgi:hypothetical protein
MIGAVVALAFLAVAAAGTATAVALRLSGVKSELSRAQLDKAAAERNAHTYEVAAAAAIDEARQMRDRLGRLESQRRAELDEVHSIAARCADPAELRNWLRRLTSEEGDR